MLSILEPSCPRIVIDAFRKAEMPYDEKTMEKRQQEQHAEHASQLGLKNHAKKKQCQQEKIRKKNIIERIRTLSLWRRTRVILEPCLGFTAPSPCPSDSGVSEKMVSIRPISH
jgi:hypothetical protein